jgi:DNA-binding transcriptional LysR family regulator
MTITHTLAIAFALAGLGTAIAAAVYWRRASNVPISQPIASISDVPETHILSGHVAFNESSRLNSTAAMTGIAAVLSAIGSVLGVL